MDEIRKQINCDVIEAFKDDYEDSLKIFAALDAKAQNTSTIAGIFIAALFAFLRENELKFFVENVGLIGVLIFVFAIVLLIATIVQCIVAMRIREFYLPLSTLDIPGMVRCLKLLPDNELTCQKLDYYYNDIAKRWQTIQERLLDIIRGKGNKVSIAQIMLLSAIIIFAGLLIYLVIRVYMNLSAH
ncbi:MAG: hypothetical protein ABSG75_12040 [Syntrophales bacterium]|jgi:hypothetical protein